MGLLAMLVERGLSSVAQSGKLYSDAQVHTLRSIVLGCSCLSIAAGLLAVYWFIRMNRKFRHSLIMTLVVSDLLKDLNYAIFAIISFAHGSPKSGSAYCSASGFMTNLFTEISDLSILFIVIHMSLQIINPKIACLENGGIERYTKTVFTFILGFPLLMACLGFLGPHGGYQLVGAFCNLPVRPFWYRLMLGWVQRYIIAITIVGLTIVIRMRVKQFQRTLEELQSTANEHDIEELVIEEDDESDDAITPGMEKSDTQPFDDQHTLEKRMTMNQPIPDSKENAITSEDLKKFKRQSFKRRQLPAINTNATDALRNGSFGAPSVAPSSAVFASPMRKDFRDHNPDMQYLNAAPKRKSIVDMPTRRQSIAVIEQPARRRSIVDMPQRRSSYVEATPRSGSLKNPNFPLRANSGVDRMNSIATSGRRSSIWDEIDASLEKKVTNRISVFSIAAPSEYNDITPPLPVADPSNPHHQSMLQAAALKRTSRVSARNSRIYDSMRRMSISLMSRMGEGAAPEEPEDNERAILRRRHRYIQRQLRYLLLYPILYLSLWVCPFILHCLQYNDYYAAHPPYPLIVLAFFSNTAFGFMNSLVFCLREKPWTMIPDSDGSVRGSFGVPRVVKKGVYRLLGWSWSGDEEEVWGQ